MIYGNCSRLSAFRSVLVSSMCAGLAALLLTAPAVLVACDKKGKDEGKSAMKLGAVPVTLHTVERRTFNRSIELEGNLDPAERILVAPSIPGVIRNVTKRAGDRITKGELLVEVDPKEVYVGTIQLRVSLASAEAQVRAASAILSRLEEPVSRLRRLYKAKAISKTDLDQIEIPYVRAREERDAGARIIQNVKSELGIAYSKLSETKLTAPFDGFVVRRLADPGETARPFPPTVVLVITKHDPLYVQAEVNEEDASSLRKSEKVAVYLDALPGRPPLPGILEEIIPYVNPMTRTVTIRVRVQNPKSELMPGMSARLKLDLAPIELLAIPRDALATEPLESRVSVFLVDSEQKARERRIRFGRSQDGYVAVLDGLTAGEKVVQKGHEQLLDGTPVTLSSAPAESAEAPTPARRSAP
ncbi:MAG: efflux RND transporter periplasmic adaptor subunit [Polyangia bacterium]|nr:efflux RND transporter periplasmic adaptor subunit [Polyangia bacterium]